jgi:hypothetical protein
MLSNLSYGAAWLLVSGGVMLFWIFIFLLVHCIVYQLTGVRLYKVIFNLMDKFDKFMSKLLLG